MAIGLLNSVEYPRSSALRAFSDAAQFAHVPVEKIAEIIDEFTVLRSVRIVDTFEVLRIRAIRASEIKWVLEERHGCLCHVCLCPISRPVEDALHSQFVKGLRFPASCHDAWLCVGFNTPLIGPVHECCEPAYRLARDVDSMLVEPDRLPRQWQTAFAKLRKFIPEHRKPLRFNPRTYDPDGPYPDVRNLWELDATDLEEAATKN